MMLKKGIVLIMLGLIFSSCDLIYYGKIAVYENKYRAERERERREGTKKDGPGAISKDEYKEDVERVIQAIMKRPVNKKSRVWRNYLINPRKYKTKSKTWEYSGWKKQGYGIPVIFYIENYCTDVFYRKKIRNDKYIFIIL